MCCASCKCFIDKQCLGKKLSSFKVQTIVIILCQHIAKPYFLMLDHIAILSRGYGNVYRKPSVDHDEMGQKQTPESVYILGMHV